MPKLSGQVAAIELRSMLATDGYISLTRRRRLVADIASLIDDEETTALFQDRLDRLIGRRFGRNPDTFEVSEATREALQLIHAAQQGELRRKLLG